ncbi:MAG: ShlB/FhaC/HecB family hemolysin secretion/activation protein [Kamptonema sp. SIO4C4]|nr:ShlB/FhaC/HecB family hemolysin secretion/activation protein [Kamptonema sp. SIO4C4]
MNYFALSFVTLLIGVVASPALAQIEGPTPNSPDLIQPNIEPLPPVEPLPPLEDLLPETTQPTPPVPEDIPGTIRVDEFEVVGNTVFSEAELDEMLARFTQTEISFAELLQVAEVLTAEYEERGYITSGAFIPADQSISRENRVVRVQAIEGVVEEINIEGLNRLNADYIRDRIALASRPPLNRDRLLNSLQLLQLDPLVGSLSVNLSAGTRPGQSILDIEATEADATNFTFMVDNQRSPSVGTMRRVARFTHNNFLGYGDRFSVGYVNTDGSNTLDGLSYTIPLNARNGTLRFTHSRGRNNIIEEPFNILDIFSDSTTYQLTYRQPLYQTVQEDLAVGLTASWQESQSFLGLDNIGPFPLSAGAENDGKTTVTALRFFQEYSRRTDNDVFALRSQFSLGLDALSATVNEGDTPDSQFFSWRLQAQYLRLLAPDTILLLRSDLQLADQSLLPFEQFAIGGLSTVRGYRQDFRIADNGMFASVEVRIPVARLPEWDALVQVAPFFDIGTVWNTGNLNLDSPTTLSSVGVGLRFRMGSRLSAQLDWGIPLVEVDSSSNTLQEDGLYFSIEYRI